MPITRVSDAQTFGFLTSRIGQQQVAIQGLQDQLASGKRLLHPEDDPLGAAQAVRLNGALQALDQSRQSTDFGNQVLGAQDDALSEVEQVMVRAKEIATQEASGTLSASERTAAAEEVRGLLESVTALGNSELAGRRLFGGLGLDASAPFAALPDDLTTYDPSTAYTGSTQDFSVKTGSDPSERVRISTRGDQVLGSSLQALKNLWTALHTNGNVSGSLGALESARQDVDAERASVGARQAELVNTGDQLKTATTTSQQALSDVQDADLAAVVTRLTQIQTALQATLAAGARLAQTSLVDLLSV